jgi:hypothetical protein
VAVKSASVRFASTPGNDNIVHTVVVEVGARAVTMGMLIAIGWIGRLDKAEQPRNRDAGSAG